MPFDLIQEMGHEQVVFCSNPSIGLRAIIAIHNTSLGPALGGTRMYPYPTEEEALKDVLRLSKGMTYKSAASGLNFGGGKAVILADPKKDKSESLFRAFGAYVNRLNGQFITGEDVGMDVHDMEYIFMETDYVVGLSKSHGGSGDPSPMTAYGVLQGIFACLDQRGHGKNLKDITVALQGLGHVGYWLSRYSKVIACDVDTSLCEKAVSELGVEIVDPQKIYDVECDIFSPCAMGGILNEHTLPRLKAKIIAGSANNQLSSDDLGKQILERNILYAPDYVINSGGLINVALEIEGYSEYRAKLLTKNIYHHLKRIFEISKKQKLCPQLSANQLAEERIRNLGNIRRSHRLNPDRIRRENPKD